jgi:hypothetical protein
VSVPPRRGANGMGVLPDWAELESAVPQVTVTMRRCLTQLSCVLRPGSVNGIDRACAASPRFSPAPCPR